MLGYFMKRLFFILSLLLSACAYEARSYVPSVAITPAPTVPVPRYPTVYTPPPVYTNSYPRYDSSYKRHDSGKHKGYYKRRHHD